MFLLPSGTARRCNRPCIVFTGICSLGGVDWSSKIHLFLSRGAGSYQCIPLLLFFSITFISRVSLRARELVKIAKHVTFFFCGREKGSFERLGW
jgi:hypothetical protein